MREFGWYLIQTPPSGYPPGYTTDSFFALFVSGRDVGWSPWLLMDLRTGATFRGGYSVGQFMPWVPIATGTPPKEHALPLETGFSDPSQYDKSKYWKNQFGEIVCSVNTIAPDIAPTHGMIIATLPPGYRPGYVVQGACTIRLSSGQVISANLAVNTLGAIRIWDVPSGSGAYITKLTGQATFIATH